MKRWNRIAAVMLAVILLLALAGCGNTNTETTSGNNSSDPAQSTPAEKQEKDTGETQTADNSENSNDSTASDLPSSGSKVLVIYFSRTGEQYTVGVIDKGNTAIVAEMIAEVTGAELFEVIPVDDHYPMTYAELTDVAKKEQNDNARPAYSGELPDLSQYDTIFIGAPVWWGDWPMIMYTVFENNDFSGKQLVPFSTHEGSSLSGFDKKLAKALPDSEILKGQAFRGNDCQNAPDSVRKSVSSWLSDLGF